MTTPTTTPLKSGFFGPQRGKVRPPQSPIGKCGMVWVWVLEHPQASHDDCLSWGEANSLNKSNVSQEYYRCRSWLRLGKEQEKTPNITEQHHDDSLPMQVPDGSIEAFREHQFSDSLSSTPTEIELKIAEAEVSSFNPTSIVDGRKKVIAEIVRRRGQPKFRKSLLDAYECKCAVTGCDVEPVLEAAHIISYMGNETNHVSNGLLLRADIHTLFDLDELKINSNGTILIGEKLENTVYGQYQGQKIRFPTDPSKSPSKEAMTKKFNGSM